MLEARLQIGMREACLVLDVSSASIYRDLEPIAAIPVVKVVVPSPRALNHPRPCLRTQPESLRPGVSIPKRPQPVVWINRPKTSLPASAPPAPQSAATVLGPVDLTQLLGDPESALFESLAKLPPSVSHAC